MLAYQVLVCLFNLLLELMLLLIHNPVVIELLVVQSVQLLVHPGGGHHGRREPAQVRVELTRIF